MATRYRTLETISDKRKQKLTRVLSQRQRDLTIVLENVHDPHNVSAVLRTADAVGIFQVHLIYTQESFPKLGKKSSASAKKWIEVHHHSDVASCFQILHNEGFHIVASHLTKSASSLFDLNLKERIAFVLGNEHRGVSDEACRLADAIYFIPMMGMIQSLNISVATAVSVYEALRQRQLGGMYTRPQFEQRTLDALLGEWAKK